MLSQPIRRKDPVKRLIRITYGGARLLALLSLTALPAMQLDAQQTQNNADREWLKKVRIAAYADTRKRRAKRSAGTGQRSLWD
jgi:hypothetical protein